VRLLHPAVGLCVLGVLLTGCGAGAPAPAETLLSMPASPVPTADASPDPPVGTATPSAAPGEVEQTDTADTPDAVKPPDPSAHCVIVAGGVTTAMLAPLSLRSDTDHGELAMLRRQILDLRGKVPADLQDDFTSLADAVEAPPEGSGKFDERSFRDAMVPVEDWLGQHCGPD
jgi:hypothetical protein